MNDNRSVRRSGECEVVTEGLPCGRARVGTPGLLQTTVERLVREGGWRDEDSASTFIHTTRPIANMRHIVGNCGGVQCEESGPGGTGRGKRILGGLQQAVVGLGPVGWPLQVLVAQAEECINSWSVPQKEANASWVALR